MEVAIVDDDRPPLYELRFDAAVKVIQSLPPDGSFQPSNDMMLRFYSFYKQATMGPCNIPRPGFWDPVGKAKWDAWNNLEQMSREEAMTAYVEEMKLILEGMPMSSEVEGLLKVLGPFYELVDEKRKISKVSDLNAARLTRFARQLEGFGNMMSSMPSAGMSKSARKSIIRQMEQDGTLERIRPTKPSANHRLEITANEEQGEESREDYSDDDIDEEVVEIKEVKRDKKMSASLPKKKTPSKKHKMSNGKMGNGVVAHLANGTHSSKSAANGTLSSKSAANGTHSSKSALNGSQSVDSTLSHGLHLNGHHTDPVQAASDSDSEVYCDSMDQFGLEEGSEERGHSCSSLGLDDDDCPGHPEDPQALGGTPMDEGLPEGVRCGGEEGESGGGGDRPRLSSNQPDSALVRRGRGSRSVGLGSGRQGALQGSGGDGERWGGPATSGGGNLNEQIVTALARLQEDMHSVLERLHTLEALTAAQARSLALPVSYTSTPVKKSSKTPSWWPFDVSPGTVAFAVVWPFLVQWLIRLYLQRRLRRIN